MAQDWFRQTEWSDSHLAAFLERNRRSRGDSSKAQHVRIQAVTLWETQKPQLAQAALRLLGEHFFPSYAETLDGSAAFCCAGQCSELLGQRDEAVSYYRQALACERRMPNVKSSAAFLLAKLAVELDRVDLMDEAIVDIGSFGSAPFPWHQYIESGVRAARAYATGDYATAQTLAQEALVAASVRDTGLGYGRGHLGTVDATSTRFHEVIKRLAGALT